MLFFGLVQCYLHGFNERLFTTFSEAYSLYMKTILEGNNISKGLPELEKIVKSRISNLFNVRFREEDFVSTLSDTVASYSTLAKSIGFGQLLFLLYTCIAWPKSALYCEECCYSSSNYIVNSHSQIIYRR